MQAYSAGLSIGGPFGLAIAPIMAGLAVATGLSNIVKINNIKLPKMAMGDSMNIVPISGKGHDQGGEVLSIGNKPVAEVEGGEDLVVLKRGAKHQLKMLSQANKMAGGKDFYNYRQPQWRNADGGFVANVARTRANAEFDLNKMGKVFSDAV